MSPIQCSFDSSFTQDVVGKSGVIGIFIVYELIILLIR